MPFCPVCRDEFRDNFKRCEECNAELVSELQDEVEQDVELQTISQLECDYIEISQVPFVKSSITPWPTSPDGKIEIPVKVALSKDEIDSSQTMSLLVGCGIPVFSIVPDEPAARIFHSAALFGSTQVGANLYVPKSMLEDALEIINSPVVFVDEDFQEE